MMLFLRNICIGLILCTSLAIAQSADTTDRSKLIGLRFSFNGLNLGGGLGAKYWLTPQGALAASMNIVTNSQLARTSDYSLSFGGQYEHHFTTGHQISPYIAGGIALGFGGNDIVMSTSVFSRPFFNVGVSVLVGVEIFITPSISLAGQQAFTASYSWQNVSSVNSPPVFTDNVSVGIGSTSLVLQIYVGRIWL